MRVYYFIFLPFVDVVVIVAMCLNLCVGGSRNGCSTFFFALLCENNERKSVA